MMKYKVGDKTLLGEITYASENSSIPYKIRADESYWVWLEEEQIDKIIIKPKRNVDHIIELLEDGKEEQARKFYNELVPLSEGYAVADEIYYFLKPYTEPSKHPQLTPEEIKALKLARDCGFNLIQCDCTMWVSPTGKEHSWVGVQWIPSLCVLNRSNWITEGPMSINELLDAQERREPE